MVSGYIFGTVIYELSYQQRFYLVILLKVDKSSKINFYHAILTFYLFINLKIEYNKELLLNIKKVAE